MVENKTKEYEKTEEKEKEEEGVELKNLRGKGFSIVNSKIIPRKMLEQFPILDIDKEEYKELNKEEKKAKARNLTFDAYFEVIKRENSKIKNHHKEAIRVYVVSKLKRLVGTREDFDKILEDY